jgi:hypothetical protein
VERVDVEPGPTERPAERHTGEEIRTQSEDPHFPYDSGRVHTVPAIVL